MISNKITRRWLLNSFGVIVAIILVLEIALGVGIQRSYYSQTRQTLENRADIIANNFQQYSQDSSKDFNSQVRDYVASFEDKDKIELIVFDRNGEIMLTSSGFEPEEDLKGDYQDAINRKTRMGYYVGSLGAESKSMMVFLISPVAEETSVMGIRLATSMNRIDKQITTIIIGLILIGIIILALVLFSSSYFINSIVKPIGEVGDTAREIAQGNFDARLNIQRDDEIGELSNIINYMADELSTAERLKNDFISSVSHELRTPLTAIQGWGETILYDKGQDTELLSKGMNVIIGETQRLSGMVEELLDFSRMQSGRLKMIKSRMDALAELSEAVLMYDQRAQRDNIDLVYEEKDLVAPVYGDKNRLRQVFINVIDNAIKYSDPGDEVVVTADIEGNFLHIIISDTGIGISEKDLPQITTKFYKADTTRRGSGIGLAVAKEIVERHDGTLAVESARGVGTTITIDLPIYTKQEDIAKVESGIPDSAEEQESESKDK